MPPVAAAPTTIQAVGNKPKVIEEFIGRVNSGTEAVSIARMRSPGGWTEPGQTPAFDEYTVVLRGVLRVTSRSGTVDVAAGQAIIAHRGEWIQYSTPGPGGAEYIAVGCALRTNKSGAQVHPTTGGRSDAALCRSATGLKT